ncbi:MAG: hypothetical protein AB1643_00100 [Patescibacteria group bacterium]
MSDVLERLFGSSARIKIIRLFLINPDEIFTLKGISSRCRINSNIAKREVSLLKDIGLIKYKSEKIEMIIKLKNGKIKNKKKKIQGLKLNEFFSLLRPLKNLLIDSISINKEKILKSLKLAGNVKLIILSGFFIDYEDGKVDLLLVGDGIRRAAIENILRKLEIKIGKELLYSIFDTKEFMYRFAMNDRFIKDILDFPHEKVLNKLNI